MVDRADQLPHGVSRRAFMRLIGLAAGGGLLAACSPSVPTTPTAAPTAAAAPKPTTAPAAPVQAVPTTAPAAAAAAPVKFVDPPALAQLVQAGKLPPIDQRLPANPQVVQP